MEQPLTQTLVTPQAETVFRADYHIRRLLARFPSIDVQRLQAAIAAVFESWKQEHGDRNPMRMTNARGGLAAARKPIPFVDAEPFECAGPTVANNIDLALKLLDEGSYRPFGELVHAEQWQIVMLVLLHNEIEAHPDVDLPSSVTKALSLCVIGFVGWEQTADILLQESLELGRQLRASARFQRGLPKGAEAGGASVKKNSESKRQQCIDIDNEVLRNPANSGWSLRKRADFAHGIMAERTPKGKRPPARATIEGYLKNNKRAVFKSMKV